jgi:cell division protein FtsL
MIGRYAVPRPVENVFLVRERDRKRTRELVALALAALPLMTVLFGIVWANLETTQVAYQIGNLEKQRNQYSEKRRQLMISRAEASSLIKIERTARTELGLVPARPEQLVLVRDTTVAAGASRPVRTAVIGPELIGPAAPESTEEGF